MRIGGQRLSLALSSASRRSVICCRLLSHWPSSGSGATPMPARAEAKLAWKRGWAWYGLALRADAPRPLSNASVTALSFRQSDMQHSSAKVGRQAKKKTKTHLAPALANLDGPKGAFGVVGREMGKAGECDVERGARLAVGQGGPDDVDEGVALVGANEDGPRERHVQRLVGWSEVCRWLIKSSLEQLSCLLDECKDLAPVWYCRKGQTSVSRNGRGDRRHKGDTETHLAQRHSRASRP